MHADIHGHVQVNQVVTCRRCHGLMRPIVLHDRESGAGQDNCPALRCLACGEIVDGLILQNRIKATHTARPAKSRARHNIFARW